MSTSTMAVELQEQLLTRDKELDSRKCAIIAWEDGLAALEHALGRACMERDAERTQAEAAQQDYLARTRAFTSISKHSINFN
jgi:hypothetical protein